MESAASTGREDSLTPGDRKLRTLLTRPWSIADFMTFALQDKETGYYTTKTPLGRSGDFITSPEISPLFGESVAVYLINAWQDAGRPSPFILLELGPGRGTLMADILRVARIVPDFLKACQIHLVECSPVLRVRQAQTLSAYAPTWHDHLEDALQNKLPLFLVANEFFDALPVHQYVRTPQGWRERGVCLGARSLLEWTTLDTPSCPALPSAPLDSFKEISPMTLTLFEQILVHLEEHAGQAFICDYGYETGGKDTLQGVRRHTYSHVLSHVGETDLSAHVDFGTLMEKARTKTRIGARFLTQRDFLTENFINVRAQQLLQKAPTPENREKILQGLDRLINDDAMGSLFKVLLLQGPNA